MDYQASSSNNLFSAVRLCHSHALLNCGSTPEQLYQAALDYKSAIRTLPGITMGGNARMSAAIYSPFESLSSYGRVEHALGHTLPAFCQQHKITAKWLHLHGPARNRGGFNPVYLGIYLKAQFPDTTVIFSQGNYLDGLLDALIQLPSQENSILSIAMDSVVDHQSIRSYLETHRYQPALVPGEAYVFFHFQKTELAGFARFYPADTRVTELNQKLISCLCCQELVTAEGIHLPLEFERRVLNQNQACRWLSSYPLCGDSGAAQQAVCLMLSYGASQATKNQSVVMLNPDHSYLELGGLS